MVSMQEELTLAHLQHVPGIMNKIIQVTSRFFGAAALSMAL
jgi:hypothetical protein